MTKEEATEIILENHPYERCSCVVEKKLLTHYCDKCDNLLVVLSPRHREALKVLSLPEPVLTLDSWFTRT